MHSKKQRQLREFYTGKTILVTGGVGSIGSEIIRKLLEYEPRVIRVLDNNETGLFDLEQELQTKRIRALVGDIRDKDRLERAVEDVDIIFHAAALKHVPLCEYNPFEAVKTNVLGTQNVLDAALDKKVQKVILISTDKAVNPTNVMGATKLLAERLTVSANNYRGWGKSIFAAVRFGNVMDSRGSVIPVFKKQIKAGGPVTVTDPEMTRFVMTIPEAVELVIEAAVIAQGGEIFILKMPSLKVGMLAESMIETFAPLYGLDPSKISIRVVGKRSGEKMYEELINKEDENLLMENERMFVRLPKSSNSAKTEIYEETGFKKSVSKCFSSNSTNVVLEKKDIKKILEKFKD